MIFDKLHAARRHWDRLTGFGKPMILMYHNIASIPVDPSCLAVCPEHFEAQIEALCKVREVVSLDEIAMPVQTRSYKKPLAAITFDDGYRNVLRHALPVLERYHCPATLFLSTGAVNSLREFWWDELTRVVLQSPSPKMISLSVGHIRCHWKNEHATPHSSLMRLYDKIRRLLQEAPADIRRAAIDNLAAQVGADLSAREEFKIVSEADLAAVQGSILKIGSHTVSHCSLPKLSAEAQKNEIEESRDFCRRFTPASAMHFSYPFGEFDDVSVNLVRRAGFLSAVTTAEGIVRGHSDKMRLPRYAVLNWDRTMFLRSLPLGGGW